MRTSTWKRTAATALAALLISPLAACGGDDDGDDNGDSQGGQTLEGMSGTEIRDAAKAAMREVENLHFVASLAREGGTMEVDSRVDADGDCEATLEMNPGTAEIVGDAEATYVKADDDFWTATAGEAASGQIATVVGDKWALVPPEQFADFCDLDTMIESITSGDQAEIEVGDVVDHDGVRAQELVTTRADEGVENDILIAYEAPHHILRMHNSGEQATIELGGFDEPVEPTLPDEGDYVDLSEIGS